MGVFEYDFPTAEIRLRLGDELQKYLALPAVSKCITPDHTKNTPDRFVKALFEMMVGCWTNPEEVLSTAFEDKYDQIIYVNSISFVSLCAHHLLPFFGKAHFGYLPNGKIIGLSKIPRLVEVYAKRPQVQEKLTREIVETFNKVIEPKGCGLVMEAYHLCMSIRGVENESAYTRTTELLGCFKNVCKEEFLDGIKKVTPQIWP